MNKQREIIYGDRRKILEGESMKDTVLEMIRKVIADTVPSYCESRHRDAWDLEGLVEHLRLDFPLPPFAEIPPDELGETPESVADRLFQYASEAYQAKETEITEPLMRLAERMFLLRTIDSKWISYLTMMEHFKEGIGLRAFGQKDPLVEYKNEAFQAFQELQEEIQHEIATTIFKRQLVETPPPPPPVMLMNRGEPATATAASGANPRQPVPNGNPAARVPAGGTKLGRNDPCWCGSGKKFKKCHGR
jgi:preprotein translocase subunit SecA